MKPKYKLGQWVRFYNRGDLVIGIILYIKKQIDGIEYCTDEGTVDEDSILEAR